MRTRDGNTRSIWKGSGAEVYHQLPADEVFDIAVVGAGIAGLMTAYQLSSNGRKVVVLDEFGVGQGQTGRTSAHLSSQIDDHFSTVERLRGAEASRMAYESHSAAIDEIERICSVESIECDFERVDAYLFDDRDSKPSVKLEDELDAASRAGFFDAQMIEAPLGLGRAIRFPRQAIFQPIEFLDGLARVLSSRGVTIHVGQRVIDVTGARKGRPAEITFGNDSVRRAHHVVVATNVPAPINDWMGVYVKQAAYRTYMVGLKADRKEIPSAQYWDTRDPYHYARLVGDVLIVGGEDHRVGQSAANAEPFTALENWARSRFPKLRETTIRWSGEVQEIADGLAFIGRAPTSGENVFVITGDSGMGLTHAALGSMIVRDQILGRQNPWETIYSPTRKELNLETIREATNSMWQYKDWLTRGEVQSESEIAPGSGAILRDGLRKLAVYRDPSGVIHKCSAMCTHLYGVVAWNDVEKTWDCPCHGSRFDAKGKVVIGPAIDDLKTIE